MVKRQRGATYVFSVAMVAIKVDAAAFTDHFGPYGAHLYKLQ